MITKQDKIYIQDLIAKSDTLRLIKKLKKIGGFKDEILFLKIAESNIQFCITWKFKLSYFQKHIDIIEQREKIIMKILRKIC